MRTAAARPPPGPSPWRPARSAAPGGCAAAPGRSGRNGACGRGPGPSCAALPGVPGGRWRAAQRPCSPAPGPGTEEGGPPRDGPGLGRDCFREPVFPTAANSSRQRLFRGPLLRTLAREGDAGPAGATREQARSAAACAHPLASSPREARRRPARLLRRGARLLSCWVLEHRRRRLAALVFVHETRQGGRGGAEFQGTTRCSQCPQEAFPAALATAAARA